MSDLLNDGSFGVANVGLRRFADELEEADAQVVDMRWEPPRGGSPELARMLADLADDQRGLGTKIHSANEKASTRLIEARPVLKDVAPAREVLDGLTETTILHAGPPVAWKDMCGAMQGAVIGGLIYEGLAETPAEAQELAGGGDITFAPCHSRDAVGPMAGILTPRMPVMVVENVEHGTVGYASMNEGWGRTLRFGAYDQQVIERLRWMENVLAPSLRAAIKHLEGVDVKAIIARALHMGDECHNRDLAATLLFFKEIAPAMEASVGDTEALREALAFLADQEHFFLNIGMAACKASLLAARSIPYSTMVTAIARNGVEVGILVSGTGDEWFSAPGEVPEGLFFPGYSAEDANPDLGDSSITETSGLGAFAMAAAPAIVRFVGGSPADALQYTQQMYHITFEENPEFTIPSLDFRGTPTGIDVRAVLDTGNAPVVNTGIAHKEAGHGLVGAGVARAPLEAFEKALRHMHGTWQGCWDEKND
jgi:hypothetical protein